jgi:3-hydroxyisobutyrate dehydrogenase
MGAPLAVRLLEAGLLRAFWNRSARHAAALNERGLTVAPSPAAAAAQVNIVCLCLLDAKAVRQVVLGPNGVVEGIKEGAAPLIIDFSTSSPAETRKLAEEYHHRTAGHWLDAPVSGGPARAAQGDLIVFCGGAEADFAQAQPVLQRLARRATLVGALGAGQTIKLCAQLIAAPTIVAMAEALAAAEANGLDARKVPELLAGGLADSPLLQLYGRRMAERQYEPQLGAISSMLKDIDAATGMARSAGSPVLVGAAAAESYRLMMSRGQGDGDICSLINLYATRHRSDSSAT